MLKRAIELRPNYWGNYNRKGIFHLRRGQLESAKAAFRNVIEVNPESSTGYNNLATVHIMAGELDQAEPLLLAAARIEPSGHVYDNIGFIYYSTDRLEKAAEQFAKAVELRPKEPLSWGNLADAYRRLGRGENAEEAYNRAIELTEARLEVDPADLDTRLAYAMYLAGLGRCVEAEAQIAGALEADVDLPERHYYAALAYAVCGNGARVIEHTRLALEGGIVADVQTNPDLRPYLEEPSLRDLLR
jgi:serine/threonine-protein kinase